MDDYDISRQVEKIREARLEVQYLKRDMVSAFCPIKRQWLQSQLFDQIDYTLGLADELCSEMRRRYKKIENRESLVINVNELSAFDGSGGRPAYVAVNGIVYDVSNEATWGGASHFGLMAGKDLTSQFNGCHGMIGILSKLPKVGLLK
jgi:predicted heme/steroid binding protein